MSRTTGAIAVACSLLAACSANEGGASYPSADASPLDAATETIVVIDSGLDENAIACQGEAGIVTVQPDQDYDGDGWSAAQGDCDDCDANANPGAFDVAGNALDEDCSGVADDEPGSCDEGLGLEGNEADDAARSLGLCRFPPESPLDPSKRGWGVLSSAWRLADGAEGMHYASHGIVPSFGPYVHPQEGGSMLVISSGTARRPGDSAYQPPEESDMGTSCGTPPGWPKASSSCPAPPSPSPIANDSASLELRIRVPTNARSMSFRFSFYTAEFPAWVCNQYDDFFVASLRTVADGETPISFDSQGNPISVNSAFLEVCTPQVAGGKPFGCTLGNTQLVGTGFDASEDEPRGHGATGWLETTVAVPPGEVITLRLMVWDGGDHLRSSTALIDGVGWAVEPASGAGTVRVPNPK